MFTRVFSPFNRCQRSLLRSFFRDSKWVPPFEIILFPKLEPVMEFGTIVSWEKKEGDHIRRKDLLAEVETDCKANIPFESPTKGYLAKLFLAEGCVDIPVGQVVCIITPEIEYIDELQTLEIPHSDLMKLATAVFPGATRFPVF